MVFQRESSAIALGALAFIAGQLLVAVMIEPMGAPVGNGLLASALSWLFELSSYVVAVLVGALAARIATHRRVVVGVLANLMGTAVLLLPAIASGAQELRSAIIAPTMFALFGWLGAIVGARRRIKGGT